MTISPFDTVAAVSTPFGKGGVAVIRLSGEEAFSVASRVFTPAGGKAITNHPCRTAVYGLIRDPESGEVALSAVDAIPTWVALDSRNGKLEYNILPLVDGERDQWKEMFNLDDSTFSLCEASYDRTWPHVPS